MPAIIEIITATRAQLMTFRKDSPLAKSVRRITTDGRISIKLAAGNLRPLGSVYNDRIESNDEADILVFVHDDVWLDDFFLPERLNDALNQFDVVGIAGARQLVPGQVTWSGVPSLPKSGAIFQGGAVRKQYRFGPTPAACELMDGVFLAAKKSTLRQSGLRFDPQFDFHFYDLDFCRSARLLGLRLGTWPIAITHESRGNFASASWQENRDRYLAKWQNTMASHQ